MRALLACALFAAGLIGLFAVPWYTLVGAGTQWPGPMRVITTGIFALAGLAFAPLAYLGHRRHRDWAARLSDAILGVVWVLFSWALLANLLRLGLWLGGIDNPLRARIVAGAVIAIA